MDFYNTKEFVKENIKLYLSHTSTRHISRNIKKSNSSQKIFLLGTPVHGNLGDHAIEQAEIKFIKKNLPTSALFNIPMPMCNIGLKKLLKLIQKKDIIIISGGGWLGDLWKHNEILVRKIIKSFPYNKIIIFPQTVYYQETNTQFAREAKYIYSMHNNLFFCLRDKSSYNYVINNGLYYKKENVLYVPDMVLTSKYFNSNKRLGVAVCFREDVERNVDEGLKKHIIEYFTKHNIPLKRTSTIEQRIIPINKSYDKVNSKLEEFSNYQLVVTDRLHAMLFSTITSTPCIAIDNKTHKVKGGYNWISEQKHVKIVENFKQFVSAFEILYEIKDVDYNIDGINTSFIPLEKILKKENSNGKN